MQRFMMIFCRTKPTRYCNEFNGVIVRACNHPFPSLVSGFMTTTRYDVLGIGNAIVDVIARTEDDFLVRQNMRKGGMQLIDEARAETVYEAMGRRETCPRSQFMQGDMARTTRRSQR